jgi:hypothetical protein
MSYNLDEHTDKYIVISANIRDFLDTHITAWDTRTHLIFCKAIGPAYYTTIRVFFHEK